MRLDEPPEWTRDQGFIDRALAANDASRETITGYLERIGATHLQATKASMWQLQAARRAAGLAGHPTVRSPIEGVFYLATVGPSFISDLNVFYEPEGYAPYVPDFLIQRGGRERDHREYVFVELDGHDFHEKTREQAEHDKRRDRWFAAHGHRLLRFTGREVWRDATACVDEVLGFFTPTDTQEQ